MPSNLLRAGQSSGASTPAASCHLLECLETRQLLSAVSPNQAADPFFPPQSIQVAAANPAAVRMTLTIPTVILQETPFDLTVKLTSPGGTPPGMVSFYDSGAYVGSADIGPTGRAVFTVEGWNVAHHAVTAQYDGNSDFQPASASADVNVQFPTTIPLPPVHLSATPLNPQPGRAFKLHVGLDPESVPPTGVYRISADGKPLGRFPVREGLLDVPIHGLSAGTHEFVATYSGDANYRPSQSEPLTVYVRYPSSMKVLASTRSPRAFSSVTLTATLNHAGAANTTGKISFRSNGQLLGLASLVHGIAHLATSDIGPGTHHISASFGGNAFYTPSTSKSVPIKLSITNTIDVLIVYTPPADITDAGPVQPIAQQAIADANQAFLNSHINAALHLVALKSVQYDESGNYDTDLTRLADPRDGFLDDVPKLRNQYHADLVSLFEGAPGTSGDGEAGGLGYVMTHSNDPANSAFGYSIVLATQADFTLAHEVGHNLGAEHDLEHDSTSTGIAAYDHGYRFTANGSLYHDIMSYDPGQMIPYFANPDVLYQGAPTGNTKNANLARLFNQTAPIVANYRRPAKMRHRA